MLLSAKPQQYAILQRSTRAIDRAVAVASTYFYLYSNPLVNRTSILLLTLALVMVYNSWISGYSLAIRKATFCST